MRNRKKVYMVRVQLLSGEIQVSYSEKIENEEDMLKELNQVLCFVILTYKRRIEKIKNKRITETDEAILNEKIKDAIVMIPLVEVREFINELES